jgi:hypothetical protein
MLAGGGVYHLDRADHAPRRQGAGKVGLRVTAIPDNQNTLELHLIVSGIRNGGFPDRGVQIGKLRFVF